MTQRRARNCRDVAILLGLVKTHNLEGIEKGIFVFLLEHEEAPSCKSGKATPYVGYQATWMEVDGWLRTNDHGSLPRLCKKLGLK
jgi:hypothetical protein